MVCNNCESHIMGAVKILHECLWYVRWPVWGYVGVESAQSSSVVDLYVLYIYDLGGVLGRHALLVYSLTKILQSLQVP